MEEENPQTWLNTKTSSKHFVVTRSKLAQHVKFRNGEWSENCLGLHGAFQTCQPATWHEQTMCYYFEIRIKDKLDTTIYVRFTNEKFINYKLPGQDSNTYNYRSDFDLRYTEEETVGAGVNYVTGEFFFTKNQKLVHSTPCNLITTLYPTVGICAWSSKATINVEVNFKGPYVFNVSHYMRQCNLKTPKKWSLQPKLAFPPFFQ
jgi:hypothetical protein